jgi:uncharacterized protein YfdQ (DUF2303 family)
METNENHVKEIADLARAGSGATIGNLKPDFSGDDVQLIVRPAGNGAVLVESAKKFIDEYRPAPERRKGTAKMLTIASFVDFANRHKDKDSALFAVLDGAQPSLTAVFDYHTIERAPRFGQHRALYQFPISEEWKGWQAQDGKAMAQGEFAAFIEEHVAELAAPEDGERSEFERIFQTKIALPSDMMTLSRGMAIAVEAKVSEARVIQTGEVQVSYDEVHKDGRGEKLTVPGLFVVKIPMFVAADPVRLIARLRYRMRDGKIVWFYQLYRANLVMREATANAAEIVRTGTELPLFEGLPES